MTEKPILFKAEMVRAILEGRKTQTRRIIKNQPSDGCGAIKAGMYAPQIIDQDGEYAPGHEVFGAYSSCGDWGCKLPYKPWNVLWVRETWARDVTQMIYRADLNTGRSFYAEAYEQCRLEESAAKYPWRPSIFMQRRASRIDLEVTGVRVEWLNDISEDDAKAEGCDPVTHSDGAVDCGTRKTNFVALWKSINGAGSWAANPLVAVYEFRRVK